jgi:hypothetical protein
MSPSLNQIALTPEQRQRVAQLSLQTGMPWQQVLDAALAGFQSKSDAPQGHEEESFYDAAKRLGLIGCVPGGPADLSTNPAYMEGLGVRGA